MKTVEYKYTGIRNPEPGGSNGNKHDVWTLQDDGLYYCPQREFMLHQWQIDHDFNLGYLTRRKRVRKFLDRKK